MVLIPLIRVAAKAAILGSSIWVTHKHGVWGNAEQGHEAAKKIADVAKQVLSETGTPTKLNQITTSLLPEGTQLAIPKLPTELPPVPSCDGIRTQAAYSWNSMVDSSVDILRNSPQLLWDSVKALQKWVRAATAPEDKR